MPYSNRSLFTQLFLCAAIADASPAIAKDRSSESEPTGNHSPAIIDRPIGPPRDAQQEGWSVTLGVAPIVAPAWQGSKDMWLSIYPDLRINYGDTFFASVPEGIGWNAIDRDGWKAGPVVRLRFGRKEDNGGSTFLVSGGGDALLGMGDVNASVELGGFVGKRFGSRDQWEAKARVVRGFGGHEGIVADLSLDHRIRSGRASIAFGPRATLASSRFMRPYYGINPDQSERTGLAQYSPSGGLLSYGLGGSLIHPVGRRSVVTLFSGLERLGGEAANSPLVRERGRPTQFTLGVGYGLRLGL